MTASRPLESHRRPLTPAERDRLRASAEELRLRARRADIAPWGAVSGVVLVLYLLTLLASDAGPLWITLFWLVAGAGLWLWVRRDVRRDAAALGPMVSSLESAIDAGEAEVFDFRSVAYAEFEEAEDEGACWAFDLRDGRIAFVRGQEWYAEDDFPSLDFSIVHALDASGGVADAWLDKRAPGSPPARVIPAERKWALADELPGHLEVIRGELEAL